MHPSTSTPPRRPSPFRRVAPAHSALVRNDRGGLDVRRFATAADAAAVNLTREAPTPATGVAMVDAVALPAPEQIAAVIGRRSGEMRHTDFAAELGISARLVRGMFKRGELPGAKEHSAYILIVPTHLLRLARAWGLRQVGRMARAGLLTTPQ